MNKKAVVVHIFIIAAIIGLGALFVHLKPKVVTIKCNNWIKSSKAFELWKTDSIERDNNFKGDYFIPIKEETLFANLMKLKEFAGRTSCYFDGINDEDAYLFFKDDGMYVVMNWEKGYLLRPCCTNYNDNTYAYPSPGEYFPVGSPEYEKNIEFDEIFGTYKEAVKYFYGKFSEDIVTLDNKNQTITTRVADNGETGGLSSDRYIVINFMEKTVTETINNK